MDTKLLQLMDLLLSEFENRPFSFEEALDYMDLSEGDMLFELLRLGFLTPADRNLYRIEDPDFYFLVLENEFYKTVCQDTDTAPPPMTQLPADLVLPLMELSQFHAN